MTESDWNRCNDPQKMLKFLREKEELSERKVRLFAVACCRRIWRLITDERSRNAVELVEQYADERATVQELNAALTGATEALRLADARDPNWSSDYWAAAAALAAGNVEAATRAADDSAYAMHATATESANNSAISIWAIECQAQGELLRELFGNPFRHPVLRRNWLRWSRGAVRRLAESVYEERSLPDGTLDRTRLAVLADALEEAGCDNEEILSHCRSPSNHVRGCWLIDLLLAKA
jgi:hypothetical protein